MYLSLYTPQIIQYHKIHSKQYSTPVTQHICRGLEQSAVSSLYVSVCLIDSFVTCNFFVLQSVQIICGIEGQVHFYSCELCTLNFGL